MPLYRLMPYIGSLAIAFYLVAPHLADEIWYDEAYTLMNFSGRGWLHAFYDYHAPNNHVIFSAMLSLWHGFVLGDQASVFGLRVLPCLMFFCSIDILHDLPSASQ